MRQQKKTIKSRHLIKELDCQDKTAEKGLIASRRQEAPGKDCHAEKAEKGLTIQKKTEGNRKGQAEKGLTC
jgi:hypothetical protein